MKKNKVSNFLLFDKNYELTHQLNPVFEKIKPYTSLKTFQQSKLFRSIEDEIFRVENGVEWQNNFDCKALKKNIRVVAWNIERGRYLDGVIHCLQNHPVLAQADILLLTETDIGMGRSGNCNVPQKIADALAMNYGFANSFIVLTKGDEGEQGHDCENTRSLHGTSILSKHRIISCKTIPLPPHKNYLNCLEKRLGQRKALVCKIRIGEKLCDFAAAHLDLKTSPWQRALQIEAILKALQNSSAAAQLIGGDFNTSTYNLKNKFLLAMSFLYKLLILGVEPTLRHYMAPEKYFEKPLFAALNRYGFDFMKYNDPQTGTLYYDINDETLRTKLLNYIPSRFLTQINRLLKPWNGCVPLRLDWFAGKNFSVMKKTGNIYGPPQIIEKLSWRGNRVSDHNPIVVDLEI